MPLVLVLLMPLASYLLLPAQSVPPGKDKQGPTKTTAAIYLAVLGAAGRTLGSIVLAVTAPALLGAARTLASGRRVEGVGRRGGGFKGWRLEVEGHGIRAQVELGGALIGRYWYWFGGGMVVVVVACGGEVNIEDTPPSFPPPHTHPHTRPPHLFPRPHPHTCPSAPHPHASVSQSSPTRTLRPPHAPCACFHIRHPHDLVRPPMGGFPDLPPHQPGGRPCALAGRQ